MPSSRERNKVKRRVFNAISLEKAVLCAGCDCVSDSPHDECLVCGSRSLFNLSRVFGGALRLNQPKLLISMTLGEQVSPSFERWPLGVPNDQDIEALKEVAA